MKFGNVFHKVIDGVHHLFVGGQHAVESVKVFIDARPGLKSDLDKLLGPVKDAIVASFEAKLAELRASSPDQAPALLKAAVPSLLSTVKDQFVAQAQHAGNMDLILSLAANAALAAFETNQQ